MLRIKASMLLFVLSCVLPASSWAGEARAGDEPCVPTVTQGKGKWTVERTCIDVEVQEHGGALRRDDYDYFLETPSGTPPERGWPVVFLFHGQGQVGQHWRECHKTIQLFGFKRCSMMWFREALLGAGFATVAGDSKVNGIGAPGDKSTSWAARHVGIYLDDDGRALAPHRISLEVPLAERTRVERAQNPDLRFVLELIDELDSSTDLAGNKLYNGDDVYAVGFSNGAQFAIYVAEYLADEIKAGAITSGGYVPRVLGLAGGDPDWHGEIPANHPPMIVINALGWDFVPNILGILYKNDLIRAGIQACHYTVPGGLHTWHNVFDRLIIKLFSAEDKRLPRDLFCLPDDFAPASP